MRHTTTRRVAAVALVAAIAVAPLAACGDDDSDDETSGTTPTTDAVTPVDAGGDLTEVCDAYTEVTIAFSAEEPPNPEALGAMLDTLDADAPDEVAEPLGVMTAAARQVLESGGEDFSAFEAPEFSDAQAEVDPFMFESCEYDTKTEVTARDYAFDGVPATLEAGTAAFLMTNEGSEAHEMAIMRKADGVTESWDDILAMDQEQAESMVVPVGGAFAPTTGSKGLAVVDLTPGDYVAICFVPTGTTMGEEGPSEGDGPPHFMEGMVSEFTVA